MKRTLEKITLFVLCFGLFFGQIQANEAKKLLVFGDSLVAGYGLSEADGFTTQLQNALDEAGVNIAVLNAGVSGDTTGGGVERLDWALFDQPDAVILELGANDALRGLPLVDTEANLRFMLTRFQEENIPVLLAGMKASPSLGEAYQNQFDAIFPKLAEDFDVVFYPFFLEGVASVLSLNQEDGIHPNPEGVAVIVDAMMPDIMRLLDRINR